MENLFSITQSLIFVGAGIGFGSFSWLLYSNSDFRRDVIENVFNVSDYVYDKYHKLRYDNKIRTVEIRKISHPVVLSLNRISYQDKDYYIIKKEGKEFELDDVIELPWLAVSLNVKTRDDQNHEVDITNILKKFWVKMNELPFHIEYYDLWIKDLLSELVLEKDDIKDIELIVIDEMGNFVNHKNVLIKPHQEAHKINLIPLDKI